MEIEADLMYNQPDGNPGLTGAASALASSLTSRQIRRRSKADQVDLREGDIVVATNGIPCHTRSTAQVMDSIEEAGQALTMDVIRPSGGSTPGASHHTFTEARTDGADGTIVTRTDTKQERRPDGSHSTSTTVTREHTYNSMTQVQNATPKPFVSSGPSTILDDGSDSGSLTLTIDSKESNIPIFKVKNVAAMSESNASWAPGSQDPYQDEILSPNPGAVYMTSPQLSYEEESGYGMAVPKVMPATPGLPAVDIQKLLEPAESPPDTPTNPNRTMRRKLYADSAFFDDSDATYPTIQEQVKLAHNVAKILMSEAAVQKSKGSRMFMKRRERAEKYVHEAKEDEPPRKGGFNVASGAVTRKPPPEAFYQSLQKNDQIGVWNPMLAAPPPAAPPPPPIMQPMQPLHFAPRTEDQKCEHTIVGPEKCFNLAAALHASKGRGGQIFAKRRAKSESWVIDEDNVKSPPPPIVPKAVLRPKNAKAPVRYEKSPWEAAMETGEVDHAFSTDMKNKRHTVGADVFNKIDMSNVPRSWEPDKLKRAHDFKAQERERKNFKDFNVRARGWGSSGGGGGGPGSVSGTVSLASDLDDDLHSVSSITSTEIEANIERRAPGKMAAGNRFSMGYDPRQPAVGRHDLAQALGARGFVAVGNSGSSDL